MSIQIQSHHPDHFLDINLFYPDSQENLRDFICILCKGISVDAVIDDNNHVFCKECINDYLKTDKNCPINPHTISLLSPASFISSVIDMQNAFCKYKKLGCKWEGKFRLRKQHLNKDCHFQNFECKYDGCLRILKNNEKESHYNECQYSLTECNFCSSKFAKNQIQVHYQTCQKIKENCTLNCGEKIERGCFEKHISEHCQKRIVQCTFENYGCLDKCVKNEITQHSLNKIDDHNSKFLSYFNDFKISMENRIGKLETLLANFIEETNNKLESFLGKKRDDIELNKKPSAKKLNRQKTKEDIEIEKFDKINISPGVSIDNNRICCNELQGNNKHFFIFHNKNLKNSSFKWKITIINFSRWIGIGVCEKKVVISNRFHFSSILKFNHGCFLLSSNSYTWNSKKTSQNNKQIHDQPYMSLGQTVNIEYNHKLKELSFDKTIVLTDVSTNDLEDELVPCVILMSKGDEIIFD